MLYKQGDREMFQIKKYRHGFRLFIGKILIGFYKTKRAANKEADAYLKTFS